MPTVLKETTVDALRKQLASAESMPNVTIDPRGGNASFIMEAGKIKFKYGKTKYGVTSSAYRKLGQVLGVPGSYIEKTPHELMVPHMNFWLLNKGVPALGFASQNEVIQLFSKGTLNPISNLDVLDAVHDVVGDDKISIHHVSHDVWHTAYSIVTHSEKTVAPGEIFRTGVAIENSYAQASSLTISAYAHKLTCSNGAFSVENVYRYTRRGEGNGHKEWVHDAVTEAFAAAEGVEIRRLQDMRNVRFNGHLADSLLSIYTEFAVPTAIRSEITDRLLNANAGTLYDIYNAITDIASNHPDVTSDSEMSRRLMRVGGQVAAHPSVCEACHRVLN